MIVDYSVKYNKLNIGFTNFKWLFYCIIEYCKFHCQGLSAFMYTVIYEILYTVTFLLPPVKKGLKILLYAASV